MDLLKMTKAKLKELYIQTLTEIETLVKQVEEQGVPNVGILLINSNYLENRSHKNPNEFIHKRMKKENYAIGIEKFQALIVQLERAKQEYELSYQNQDDEKSEIIQNNIVEIEKGNQNKRGGKRAGAGRKGFGVTKKVSLTLSEETWDKIKKLCEKENSRQSKILRELIETSINEKFQEEIKVTNICEWCGREDKEERTKKVQGYTILRCCFSCEEEILEDDGLDDIITFFKEGEKVRIVETGEVVTVIYWHGLDEQTYHVSEDPDAEESDRWYMEDELEKIIK